jgi:pyridoxal phosphate enzyme (YggS family)
MVKKNIARLRGEIFRAAVQAGRNPADIKIVAVTKNVPVQRILPALEEGITDLGENRVQELLEKQPLLDSGLQWHMIGHLQTNKVKSIVGKISLLHSLDSWRLAVETDNRSREAGIVTGVLVQVNVAGENTKYGLGLSEAADFIGEAGLLKGLAIKGLMTIAPYVDDPEEVRPVFASLRGLFHEIREKRPEVPLTHLSMGMTNDYLVAVEEGATILRIGTGIFGGRF